MKVPKYIELITTDDGSHSLFVPDLKETYHSFHGAVQESRHVFIQMGLDYQLRRMPKPGYKIFEVGMGTALNVLLTAEFAQLHRVPIHMTSIEAYPINWGLAQGLNYCQFVNSSDATAWFEKIHTSNWQTDEPIHQTFTLKKIKAKLEETCLPQQAFDIIFFDAFAPNKQKELWSMDILTKIVESITLNGLFVTYCAKGQLKRDLSSLGLQVNTLVGPPGKKEMIQAVKI